MTEETDHPHLRVVASEDDPSREQAASSKQEALRERFEDEISYMLRKHAANVLRVVRGAGSPHSFYRDCCELIERFHDYHNDYGRLPPVHLISEHMKFDLVQTGDKSFSEQDWAFERMVKGSLQLAAATLLNQRLQVSAGETQLVDGIRAYEKYTEERRAQWARTNPPSPKKRSIKASRKPKQPLDYPV